MSGYVYIRSEPELWTTGHYAPDGTWVPESDHESVRHAAERAAYLNGYSNSPAYDLVAHMRRQIDFSIRAFGPGERSQGVIDHIRKELKEIEAAPGEVEEWIDVVTLALDGAWRAGFTAEQVAAALAAKLAKNEQRTWPDWRTADPTKAIEHDRTGEQGGAA